MKKLLSRPLFIGAILMVFAGLAFASYRLGIHAEQSAGNRNIAYVQATLAFEHHKASEHIESLLLRKCYEAAVAEVQQRKKLQLVLLFENLRATKNDAELVEYIKVRDSRLLEVVLAGRVPELKPYATNCP